MKSFTKKGVGTLAAVVSGSMLTLGVLSAPLSAQGFSSGTFEIDVYSGLLSFGKSTIKRTGVTTNDGTAVADADVADVEWGAPTDGGLPYFGIRGIYWPDVGWDSPLAGIGFGLEYTNNRVGAAAVEGFDTFDIGLGNILTADVVYQIPTDSSIPVIPYVLGGVGFSFPTVKIDPNGVDGSSTSDDDFVDNEDQADHAATEGFKFTGLALRGGVGVVYSITDLIGVFAEYQLTYVNHGITLDNADGDGKAGEVQVPLFSNAINVGVGFAF